MNPSRSPVLAAVVFVLLVGAVGAATPEETPAAPVVAFVDVMVIPMDREVVLPGQTVVVRGDRIEAAGPKGELTPPAGATVVDGAGRFLLPGLTDAHVHLDPLVGARPEFGDAPLYLAAGVTTVFNLRGGPEHLEWRRRIAEGELLAPNLVTSGEFVDEPRVTTPEEVEREVLAQAAAGYDLVKHHQVMDPEGGGYATTVGLSRPAYLRLAGACREAGIPLVGHAPVNLGLKALLEAGQPLADVGELGALHFLPVAGQDEHLRATGLAVAALAALLLAWALTALARRLLGRRAAEGAPEPGRVRRLSAWLLVASAAAAVCYLALMPGGRLTGSLPLLVALTALGFAIGFGTLLVVLQAAATWRQPGGSVVAKAATALAAAAAMVLAGAMAHWVPIPWRSTDRAIAKVAQRCRESGVWVQSTLMLYDSFLGTRHGYRPAEIVASPDFARLAPEVQESWRGFAERHRPRWLPLLLGRYPDFNRKVVAALHREGVPLMAGTDAMGAPLVLPGSSLHLELEQLAESGLSRYEVLRTATAMPARFLGREEEWGTVRVGLRADLLLVTGNPLEDLTTLARPEGVMVRGRWLPRELLEDMLEAMTAAPPA